MKRLLALILLTGAFLGGYYLGRLPDSPDIFAWGRNAALRSAEIAHKVIATLEDWNGESAPDFQRVGQADPQDDTPR
ncbi:MAG: hypothetical protein ACLFV7_15330 [Phycisphaerae bacterium]